MRVRAKTVGFYDGNRRREGEVFEVRDGIKLGAWMEPVSGKAEQAPKVQQKEPDTLSGISKTLSLKKDK